MVISYEDLFNLMKEKLVKHSCPEDLATRAARNDGVDACKNAVYKTVAEEAWKKEEKESKKKKVESKLDSL